VTQDDGRVSLSSIAKTSPRCKKTRPGWGKPPSPTLPGVSTQGTHNPMMAKKSRNQQVPVEKTPEPWPPITNGSATSAHFAMAQARGWHAEDRTREWMRHSEGIFLTRPKICPTRGSNPRPRGATREPQPSGLRTFRTSPECRDMLHPRGD
jgi:hypothetical protein